MSTGSLIEKKRVHFSDFLHFKLPFPSLPEQQKIAAFLTAVDRRLALLRDKLEKLESFKRGVMQREMGKEKMESWNLVFAGEVFESISNKNHNSDLPVLAITQDDGAVYRDELEIDIKSTAKSIASYKIVEPGDFIISLRSFQGGLEYSELLGICSPAYTVLKPKQRICDSFYRAYFKKARFIERLSKTVVGIRDGKQISYTAFAGLKIPLPPMEEQQKIAAFLQSIDRRIELVQQQLAGAEAFKRGLLQGMFV